MLPPAVLLWALVLLHPPKRGATRGLTKVPPTWCRCRCLPTLLLLLLILLHILIVLFFIILILIFCSLPPTLGASLAGSR
jgi:preprotein translocase subunit SecG